MFYQLIKKNKLAFFKQGPAAGNPKQKTLKEDCCFFSQLFIPCQSRKCDLQEFFKHENQPVPAALSDNGKLHSCQKSQLVGILEAQIVNSDIEPEADVIVIDGSALLNALPPRASKTFDDYTKNDVFPTIEALSVKYKRTDVVFDVHLPCSLKSETREKRWQGIRRRVTGISKTPKNWKSFLRDGNNNTELFYFLADKITEISTSHTIVITKGENYLSNQLISSKNLAPCSHEEADIRMFVHARHAAMEGNKALVIKANDTDDPGHSYCYSIILAKHGLQKMWIMFSQGSSLRCIAVHVITLAIGPEKMRGLLFFHAFPGCDITSAFNGKGKKSVWLNGMHVQRHQVCSRNSASTHQQ